MTGAATADGKVIDFGARVSVRGLVRPWVGHALDALPRYYPGRKRMGPIRLHAVPDTAFPDHWPGAPIPGSDSPHPQREAFLRWRRLGVDPRPLRAVVLRHVTRTEGRFGPGGRLTDTRRVHLVEIALAPPHRPQTALAHPADLTTGWKAA